MNPLSIIILSLGIFTGFMLTQLLIGIQRRHLMDTDRLDFIEDNGVTVNTSIMNGDVTWTLTTPSGPSVFTDTGDLRSAIDNLMELHSQVLGDEHRN